MTNYYATLRELEGEPVDTERVPMGLSAGRIDRFRCGCVRTYIARSVAGRGEHEDRLSPCPKHRYLLETQPGPQEPEATQQQLM